MIRETNPFLLVSHALENGVVNDRRTLSRVIIPVEVAEKYERLPQKHIWWVEKAGKSYYLRAKLYVMEAVVERELKSNLRRAVWYLDMLRSERITWSRHGQRNSNITSLLLGIDFDHTGGISLTHVTDELDAKFEGYRLSISEQTFGFDNAARQLQRLFSANTSLISKETFPTSLKKALHYAHVHFAREELIGTCSRDPYEVAAAVMIGCTEMPGKNEFQNSVYMPVVEFDEFSELDEEHISHVERNWRRADGAINRLNTLEAKTKKHQLILQSLARVVRTKGFLPTYNRHVDLRLESEESQIFFEVKTADTTNFREQVRYAVGQLLEYRHRYKKYSAKEIKLVIVVEANAFGSQIDFIQNFLPEIGISIVLWQENANHFDGLDDVLP